MVFVAVLLLPLVSLLLLVMDRLEDRMLGATPARRRHAGRRGHLRLIPGGRRDAPAGDGLPARAGRGAESAHGRRRAA
ncbi:hypothetical protein ABZ920_13740 [Streptomyces sp. NPDC046831]|uniref:hypothetical protein n=1 Tax=Streptomyces sp. NPDC046831 TaxID=3154805 RepID=UPI0033D9C3BD